MNIVYTLNDKFVPQVAASICSVCENNKNSKITFYLISDGISKENQKLLRRFTTRYRQKLEIIEIGDIKQYFDFDFDTTGWNSIVLARLVLDKLLPKEVDRVLYLDGDTIIRGDLDGLYDTNMGESVIGAGVEPTADRSRKLALDIKGLYYNAGVLLINMKKWRKEKTGKKILEYYAAHNGRLFANDQDAINGALKGEIYSLLPKYNFCNIYNQYPYRFLRKLVSPDEYFTESDFDESVRSPIIIHYLGEERPWRAGNHHKYRDDYKKYLAKTPWKNTPGEDGWRSYYICWGIFNAITKPFPALRYKVITSLIPLFINARAKKNHKHENDKLGVVNLTGKVSVLIPAYNAEKFISKSIDSVLSQTYQNIEIIVVNDGSTDKTRQILQKYARMHPEKIKIFSQKNQGLGATRNVLLGKASGDYIINLDADDWLKPDYIEEMLTAIKDGDIAICGFERYDDHYRFRDKRIPKPGSYAKYRFCTTAGKMFRTEFIRQNKLSYNSINMGEDAFFNVLSYAKATNIAILPYSGYCCYENTHSMAHTAQYSDSKSYYRVMHSLVDRLHGTTQLRDKDFQFYVFKNLLMDVFLYKNNLSTRDLIKIYRRSVKWYKKFLHENHSKFHLHFQEGEAFVVNLAANIFIASTVLHLDWMMLGVIHLVPINML